MKSITIHKLENALVQRIESMAAESGLSQNKVIKRLLRQALGLDDSPVPKNDFEKFAGLWTEEEEAIFNHDTEVFSEIDHKLWD